MNNQKFKVNNVTEKGFITVLIAEDNQVSRQMMAKILAAKGLSILEAANGDEAIEIIKKKAVDLAIVDINMAPTGGFEFVKYLVVKGIDLPVVVVTADDSSDLLIESSSLGVQRVLQKPVQPQRLVDTVVHILKRRGLNPSPVAVERIDTRFSGEDLMKRAIDLAEKNYKSGKGGPYGAIIANEKGEILGEGVAGNMGRVDPTAHAEVMAIRRAAEKLNTTDLKDCILYVSSEPTMMGKALIISVGIRKVYFGLSHDEIKSVRQSEEKVRQGIVNQEQAQALYTQLSHEEAMDMFQGWIRERALQS
jgi:tRNA(Arg) A34 adenosine deaminase TadA/ActR/RegA family two-component response regulator